MELVAGCRTNLVVVGKCYGLPSCTAQDASKMAVSQSWSVCRATGYCTSA